VHHRVDLASKLDLCAEVRLFAKNHRRQNALLRFRHLLAAGRDNAEQHERCLQRLAETGKLQMTSGSVTDLDFIEQGIRESNQRFKVRELAYDKAQATQMMTHLTNEA